jgi:hypothetical protein
MRQIAPKASRAKRAQNLVTPGKGCQKIARQIVKRPGALRCRSLLLTGICAVPVSPSHFDARSVIQRFSAGSPVGRDIRGYWRPCGNRRGPETALRQTGAEFLRRPPWQRKRNRITQPLAQAMDLAMDMPPTPAVRRGATSSRRRHSAGPVLAAPSHCGRSSSR